MSNYERVQSISTVLVFYVSHGHTVASQDEGNCQIAMAVLRYYYTSNELLPRQIFNIFPIHEVHMGMGQRLFLRHVGE